MRGWALLLCCLLVGCGSGSDDSEQSSAQSMLIGKWLLDTGAVCVSGATFDGSKYELDLICVLDDGRYGVEAQVGSYGATDQEIDFVPELASCVVERNHDPYTLRYQVADDTLRLITTQNAGVFERLSRDPKDLGSGSATIVFGCVEPEGFYDGEVVPVN